MRIIIAILVVLLIVLQYDLWVGEGSIATVWSLQKMITTQEKENAQLKERNSALEAEVRDLKQGLDAIEERARSELGMINKNETFVQVVEE